MTQTIALREKLKKGKGMGAVPLAFLLGVLGAFFIFLPFAIVDKGFFLYAGDYNVQQIPFYMYVNQFIKNGGGTWSWATDLGSSVVNSFTFYNIGSPFLWISLIFPSRWMPYMMVPMFLLKFGCISAAACLYLNRYAKTRNMAVICSVLYAFCGFNVYNIFFNHMLDPVVIFPLMLWAMDGFVLDGKRGWFAISVGLSLLNSYFFFAGNVIFLILYFLVKVILREYRLKGKQFALLVLEAVLGVGIGMVLALPSFFNLIGNPRTENFAQGFGLVMYGRVQQYFAIFASMFFPPDVPYMPNLFTDGVVKWTSMSAYLPVVSMAGVIAYCKGRKKSSVKVLMIIGLVCAMVPILNSMFYAFNASYYARWYYMPILMMVHATLRSLEDEEIDLLFGAKVTLGITAAFAIFGFLPIEKEDGWHLGLAEYQSKFWLTMLTAVLGIGIFYALVKLYRGKVKFAPLLLAAIMSFSAFYSVIHLALGKFPQWERDKDFRQDMYVAGGEIELPDDQFYRIDAFGAYDNLGLWLDESCLQTFNSTVTPSIMEFYPLVGVKRDVSSKPEAANYPLRGLLSVRYTLVPLRKIQVPVAFINATPEQLGVTQSTYSIPYDQINVPYDPVNLQLGWAEDVGTGNPGAQGWHFLEIQSDYAVFVNENFVPLGFTYDEYIAMSDLQLVNESDRSGLLMRGIGLTKAQETKYGYLFDGQVGERVETDSDGSMAWYQYQGISYDQYMMDCAARRADASYHSEADSSGFTVKIEMDKENLVFFGVPYDEGFTATVNGQEAEVLKVSGGMMAVYAPAGDNTIVLKYKTPGMAVGGAISIVSIAILVVYMVLSRKMARKKAGVVAGPKGEGTARIEEKQSETRPDKKPKEANSRAPSTQKSNAPPKGPPDKEMPD